MKVFNGLGNLQVVSVPPGMAVEDCIAAFQRSGLVEYAEPDYVMKVCVTPNDPQYPNQWALPAMAMPAAWGLINDATSVIVAVLDRGVDASHPDLVNNIWTNPREVAGNGLDEDNNGYSDDMHGIDATLPNMGNKPWAAGNPGVGEYHGSMVAGVIGAQGNNSLGMCGICWRVKLMLVRVSDSSEEIANSWLIEGMDYAVENGAAIMNMSFTGPGDYGYGVKEMFTKARNRGVIVVAGIGNDGTDNDAQTDVWRFYPASYEIDNVVSVGASGLGDVMWSNSRYGLVTCDLIAPGDLILSTDVGGYWSDSGTSLAAPQVSGMLALLKAQFPQDNYQSLINRLLSSTDTSGAFAGKCATGGRVNGYKAVTTTSGRPPNDDCQNAFQLAIPTGRTSISAIGNNIGATTQAGENLTYSGGVRAGHSIWWYWISPPTISSSMYAHTVGSGFDTVLAVYEAVAPGYPYPPTSAVASDNNGGGCHASAVTLDSRLLKPNQMYLFVVDGAGAYDRGAVRLTLGFGGSPQLPAELWFDETTISRDTNSFSVRIYGTPGMPINIESSETLQSSFDPASNGTYDYTTGWRQRGINQIIPSQGYFDYTDSSATNWMCLYRCRLRNSPDASTAPQHYTCSTVGYCQKTVPPGWTMVSNPLIGQSICIPDVFRNVPVGFAVYSWDEYSQSYLTNVYQGNGVWSGPDCLQVRQGPGSGCFVYNPQATPVRLTFTGHVLQGYYENNMPGAAWAIRSPLLPDRGELIRNLQFPAIDGVTVEIYSNGSYLIYQYISLFGGWCGGPPNAPEPRIDAGDAFWVYLPSSATWRTYYQTWMNGVTQ